MERAHAPVSGPVVGEPDYCAAFTVVTEAGMVVQADYLCTTCVTLVALCEALAELVRGRSVAEARRAGPENLLRIHPEVPPERRHAAELAVRALRSSMAEP